MRDVYVTRDSLDTDVRVYPAYIGVRKFPGCIEYGAAWCKNFASFYLHSGKSRHKMAESIDEQECRRRYGFYPRSGEVWLIEGKKRTKQYLAFSP